MVLTTAGLQRFQALRAAAVDAVTRRFYAEHREEYARFGTRGEDACREDLAFHLEFLRPVIEFGLSQPMVDYLIWLESVLAARSVPTGHLGRSLDWLAEFFRDHMDAAEGEAVAGALRDVRQKFEARDIDRVPPKAPDPWPEAALFENALLAGSQRDALRIMNRCIDGGCNFVEFELHVIQPSLYAIGEKWQLNRISVAKEHMATAIVHSVMTAGLLRVPLPEPIGRRVLLACVEGNNHAVGLRMVADAFQFGGWDVQYLGANVPTPALIQQAQEWSPHLIGLSVSFPQQLRVVRSVMSQLDAAASGAVRPPVIIGGLAINRFRKIADMVGADAQCGDAQAAVAYADHMAGR